MITKLRFFAVWTLLCPLLLPLAYVLDLTLGTLLARRGQTMNYGVLARRL